MDKTILCCLCVRDCEKYLKDIFRNLDELSTHFLNFYVVFVFDNCKDNSVLLLDEYKNNSKFKVYVIYNINNSSDCRPVRIASSRNLCLDTIETIKNDFNKNVDFHLFIDADDVNAFTWNIDTIKGYIYNADTDIDLNLNLDICDSNYNKTFYNKYNNDWDILTFNRDNYYDIWALLYDDFKHQCYGFNNCELTVSNLIIEHMKNDIQNKLKNMKDNKLYDCYSAFNGFGIYRTNKLKNIRYDGTYDSYKNLFNEEEKEKTVNKIKIELPQIDNLQTTPRGDCCEHLYYNITAHRQNNARVRISKKILEKK